MLHTSRVFCMADRSELADNDTRIVTAHNSNSLASCMTAEFRGVSAQQSRRETSPARPPSPK